MDKTGIPKKMGVTDIYFSQGNLNLEYVYPNIQVIGKVEIKSAEIAAGIVSPYLLSVQNSAHTSGRLLQFTAFCCKSDSIQISSRWIANNNSSVCSIRNE